MLLGSNPVTEIDKGKKLNFTCFSNNDTIFVFHIKFFQPQYFR